MPEAKCLGIINPMTVVEDAAVLTQTKRKI
jgi:hypothetical protein